MPLRISMGLVLCWLVAGSAAAQAPATPAADAVPSPAARGVGFRHDVWPLLKRHCWGCHNAADPQGGLAVETVPALLQGGDSGPAILPGQAEESLLLQVLSGAEPTMPKEQPPLAAAKIETLRQWIAAGAADDSTTPAGSLVEIPAVYSHPPPVTAVAFSPDGSRLAAACRSEVALIDLSGQLPVQRLATESELLTWVEFSPDGGLLCAAGGVPAVYGEVRGWGGADGALRWSRRAGLDALFRGGFSPNGAWLALGSADSSIYLLDAAGQQQPRPLLVHSDWVHDVAFSMDGRLLLSASRDKSIKASLVETGELLRSLATSSELVAAVVAAPGLALGGGREKSLAAYDLRVALGDAAFLGPAGVPENPALPADQPAQYTRPLEGQPGEVLDLAVNADRSLLAVAGAFTEVRVYRTADSGRVATLAGVQPPVHCVALSADGTRLAAGNDAGRIYVFDVATGMLLQEFLPLPVAAP